MTDSPNDSEATTERRLYLAGRFVLALTAPQKSDEAARIMAEIMADEETTVQVIGVLAHMVAGYAEELMGSDWRSQVGFAMHGLEMKAPDVE